MILQSGLELQINNLLTLIGTKDIANARALSSLESVRIAYRAFIERLQKRSLDGASGKVNIVSDMKKANALRPLFINDSLLDDKHQSEVIVAEEDPHIHEKSDLVRRAQQQIANLCPQHAAFFDTIITDIFILPSNLARGGSTSQAIGVMWANPKIDYSIQDVMEMLLHELTHHTLFIDELCYRHYDYSTIIDRSTWAKSAILNTSRPLDKVLHSIVVSMEILLLREYHLGHPALPRVHPPTIVMLSQLADAITSLEAVLYRDTSIAPQLFRPRAMAILNGVKHHLATLNMRVQKKTIGGGTVFNAEAC